MNITALSQQQIVSQWLVSGDTDRTILVQYKYILLTEGHRNHADSILYFNFSTSSL